MYVYLTLYFAKKLSWVNQTVGLTTTINPKESVSLQFPTVCVKVRPSTDKNTHFLFIAWASA